ncbi:uncharacterized protein [Haliotis cracherodii]|uniref:uncharacterized protein n=1 Tax=Haliotis cracherodii TaxID=6455 RepID=UPI0039EAE125
MGVSRITPVHVATWVFIVTVVSGIESEKKYCDVRLWYLDLVTDGPLAGQLSEERVVLKAKIEKMMEKYKAVGRSDGKVECRILALYEELLRADDKPTETPGGEKKSTGSVDEPEKVKDRKDNESPQQKQQTDSEQKETDKDKPSSPEDDTDLDETEFGDETEGETEAESDSAASPSGTASESVQEQETAGISNQETKTGHKQEDEPVKSEEEPKSDSKVDASQETTSSSGKKTRMVEEFVFDPLRGYVKVMKEVDIVDEEEKDKKKGQESDKSEATPPIETKKTLPETETLSKEKENIQEKDVKEKETESKEQTVILQSSNDKPKSEPKVPKTLTSLQRIENACLYRHKCAVYCYYGFSNRKCLEHYPDIEYKVVPELQTEHLISETISESSKDETAGDNAKNKMSVTEMLKKKELSQQESKVVPGANLDKPNSPELGLGNSKPMEVVDMAQTKKSSSAETNEAKTKSEDKNDSTKKQNQDRADEGSTRDSQGFRDFTEDLHRFERQFQERASEYASKIQSLEIMIMKLENQLLGETINKQNDSNVLSRLENQILRLENDLLKLNHNYVTLKEENDIIKARQGKYLKLGHDKGDPNQPSLTDKSTKHHELITQQQSKISELSTILKNHSILFNQLQSKSQHLEEQNQMLYQIVMNQTALISSIMKKMQDLSEESLKHRHETQELKTKLEIKANSDRILERLDNLVSGTPAISKSVVDDGKPEEKVITKTLRSFFPKSPDAIVEKRPWSCGGINSSRFCVMYSLVVSPCPPFSTVYWEKCPYFLKDISKIKTNGESKSSEVTASEPDNKEDAEEGFQTSHLPVNEEKESKDDILTKESQSDDTKTATKGSVGDSSSHDTQEKESSKAETDSTKQTNDVTSPEPSDQAPAPEPRSDDSKMAAAGGSSSDTQKESSKDEGDSTKQTNDVTSPPAAAPEERKILYPHDGDTPKPRDCYEYYEDGHTRNGMYKIHLVGLEKNLPVYCDMRGGGWTIVLKRSSGGIDFNREWSDYQKGFGGLYADHWIGNDNLHYFTNQKNYRLRVDLSDFKWESRYAEYDTFWTDDEEEGYRLHIGGYSGTAGDSFLKHNNMKFSTKDVDNDLVNKELKAYDHNCAKRFHSGWWYYKCYMTNLTGRYYKKGVVPDKQFDGVSWKTWKGPSESLKEAVMKIRPFGVTD